MLTPQQKKLMKGLNERFGRLNEESQDILFRMHPHMENREANPPENMAELEAEYMRIAKDTAKVVREMRKILENAFPPKKVFKMVPFNEYKPPVEGYEPQGNGPKRP